MTKLRLTALLLAVLMLLAGAALADGYSITGNGSSETTFYVEAYGSATVTLTQGVGTCAILKRSGATSGSTMSLSMMGYYHIQYRLRSGSQWSTVNWTPSNNNADYTLRLSSYGSYEVKIVPYTADEITAAYGSGTFLYWREAPRWYLTGYNNCTPSDTPNGGSYTPVSDGASTGTLSAQSVNAGESIQLNITRATVGVTHMVEWVSPAGARQTINYGTSLTARFSVPSDWPSGTASLPLVTYSGRTELGSRTYTFEVTARPSYSASTCYLSRTTVTAGSSLVLYVIRSAPASATHSVIWTSAKGTQQTTSLPAGVSSTTFTVPKNWAAGTGTATLITYVDGVEQGRNSTSFTIYAAQPDYPASEGYLSETSVIHGQEILLYVKPQTSAVTVTHYVEWKSASGQKETVNYGTLGTASYTIPYEWTNGTATATLITYYNNSELGRKTYTFTVTSDGGGTTPTGSLAELNEGVRYPYKVVEEVGNGNGGYELRTLSDDVQWAMTDTSPYTCYNYTLWMSCKSDNVPDLDFYFGGVTMDALWIRSGNHSNDTAYYANARPQTVEIYVITGSGQTYTFSSEMKDSSSNTTNGADWIEGYQPIRFGWNIADVEEVQVFVRYVRVGNVSDTKYNICISDVLFHGSDESIDTSSGSWAK